MKNVASCTLFSRALFFCSGLAFSHWALLFLPGFLVPIGLPAQNTPHPSFHQYGTDDGLASSEVYCILQDREGFIWISSDNGISRFDGYEFRNYGVKDGLLENVIFMMQLDTLGRLWMQAMSGNLYFMEGDSVLPYWHNKVLLNFKNRQDVGKGFIVEGAGETVHISTLKYGVITISQDGSPITYPCDEPFCWQLFEHSGIAINALIEQEDPETTRIYWEKLILENRSGSLQFNTSEGNYTFSDLQFSEFNGQSTEVFRLAENRYLIKILNDVWLVEDGNIQWQHYFPYHIDYAQLMANGQLFVGLFFHQGLMVFHSLDDFRKNRYFTWLPGQSVSYFMEDREGGRWFATNDGGVFYTPADAFLVYDKETGLADEKVTALAIRNETELFAGFRSGEVWQLDQLEEKWTPLANIPWTAGYIRELYFDPQNETLWAGINNLFRWKNEQWLLIQATQNGNAISIGDRITQSPDGQRLWLSNFYGFMSLELPQLQPANLQTGRDQRTYITLEDFSGRVWVGQPKGLCEWLGDTLIMRQDLHPAFSLRIEDMALLPDSSLAIATKGGGVVFWKDDQFEQITTEQGLTANMMECLHADANGVLWAGTLNGLNRISGNWGQRHIEQITVFHGLPSNEINRISTFGEYVWLATNKGLVRFSDKAQSHYSPPPILSAVLANNHPINISYPLSLHSSENNLTIHYLTINYKMNGQILYRFRMDGNDWTQTFNRSLNFPELPPGHRLFEVQSQNEDGLWSKSTTLQLIIQPSWWAKIWAKLGLVLAILGAGLGMYKYRTGQLKKENQIQLQIATLERSALQAQMNPHFIFNCLNSIQHYILQNEKEAAIMYLGRFAALVRSTLNASVAGHISLNEEITLLDNYLALEKLRFKERFTFEILASNTLNVFDIEIPPLLVQPYVENAVHHGISGRTTGGMIQIFFEQKETYLEVSIKDNGPGIEAALGQSGSSLTHKSFGMSITRNRLELLSDKKEAPLVQTQTLVNESGDICGTQVLILITLSK